MEGKEVEQSVVAEIDALKALAHCKVIKNAGDFAYLIDANIHSSDITIKFQLTAEYPSTCPTIFVRHPTIGKDELQKATSSIPTGTTSLVEILKHLKYLLLPVESSYKLATCKQVSPKSSRNRKKLTNSNTDSLGSKKPSMRTAADVIKRIQWDSTLEREKFIVGYLDRFLGVQEQPFNAFNWVNPAEADWMDLNIPEHRIEYFKYNDKVVWEKKSRLDDVFGSTGGKTIDQCIGENNSPTGDSLTGPDAGQAPNKLADVAVNGDIPTPALLKATKTYEEDSSDDDIQITIGRINNSLKLSPNGQQKQATSGQQIKGQSCQSKGGPNHFIAIPVTEPSVLNAVNTIQDEYLTLSDSEGFRYMVEPYNLHITVCAIRIDTQEQLDAVSEILYELVLAKSDEIRQEFSISKLDTFWNRVLYAKATLNESFHDFVSELLRLLKEKKIPTFDSDEELITHLTLLKFPRQVKDIHFSINHYLKIKRESQTDDFGLSTSLEQFILYSMERDSNNHYIEKLMLDI